MGDNNRRTRRRRRAVSPEEAIVPKYFHRRQRKMEPVVENFSNTKFTLNSGREMPAVGLGTYRIRLEEDVMKTVEHALDAGYRMFDTAAVYGNEVHLGKAFKTLLPKFGLEREDIFVTTKLSPSDHGGKTVVRKAVEKSLNNLGLENVDLFLAHWPGSSHIRSDDPKNKILREETWASLEELYDDGIAYSIGVSNFTRNHLTEILANHSVIPAVNQVEWHPYYYQPELLKFCKKNDVVLQAYCSLGGTSASNFSLMENPVVKKIATKHNRSCAQVLLVWALQKDVAVIPKSKNPDRIRENMHLNFRLNEEEVKKLDELGDNNVKYAWDPSVVC